MGCLNYSDAGQMVGVLCSPCYEMLTTGEVHPKNPTFIGDMKREIDEVNEVTIFFEQRNVKRRAQNAATG
jgi:hypothetical protein